MFLFSLKVFFLNKSSCAHFLILLPHLKSINSWFQKVLIANLKRVNSFHQIENMLKLFNKMSMALSDTRRELCKIFHTQRVMCNFLINDEVGIFECIYIFKRLLTSCKRFLFLYL